MPPARASPACSTPWSARRGGRRRAPAHDLTPGGGGLGRRGRHRAARLALGGAAPPRGPARPGRCDQRATPWNLDGLVLLDLPDFDSRVDRAPGRVRAGARARRRLRLGHRPAEVRRRPAARRLPARPVDPRRRHGRGAQPGRPPGRARPRARSAATSPRLAARRRHPRRPGHHRPPPPPAPGSTTSGCGSPPPWLPRTPPSTACWPTCRPVQARCAAESPPPSRPCPSTVDDELVDALVAGGRHPHGRGRGRARLPQPGLGPHRVAVHPLGASPASRPDEAAAAQHARRRGGEARRHRRRRAHRARPVVPPAAHPRSPLGGGAGHPTGRRPGRRGAAQPLGRGGRRCRDAARARARRRPRPGRRRHLPEDAGSVVVAGLRGAPSSCSPWSRCSGSCGWPCSS